MKPGTRHNHAQLRREEPGGSPQAVTTTRPLRDERRRVLSQIGAVVRRNSERSRSKRFWALGLGHLVVFALVYWLAFELRFEFKTPVDQMQLFWTSLPWILAAKFIIFCALGHYDGWWAYVTFADLVALIRAAALSLFCIAAIDYFDVTYHIPRSVIILDCVLGIVVLGAIRASWRQFREQFRPGFDPKDFRWALLVGTDHASGVLAHHIQSNHELPYRIKGFLSISGEGKGARMGQIPVLGSVADVHEIAKATKASDVFVTAGALSGRRLRQLMETCEADGLNLKVIPSLEDRLDGDHRIPMRNIEINDLLRREPVVLDTEMIGSLLEGRTVMVTGAGGSIGSEICRQVLKFAPKALVLVGHAENPIFMVERELRRQETSVPLCPAIGDITDGHRMRQLFEQYRPEVIFHAAAHKHVPLMETNVGQAIRTNVCGTKSLADLAHEFKAASFVFISTDKAVHPSSVMGTSKHIAERYIHTMSQESSTRFTVVRFGNVLGSDGSVVPVFQEQIRNGGPITVTDPRMTRFFMTIPEASQLVLQAASMGKGGEIFVLEMGEPVRIIDLARDLVRLSGLPEDAIEIACTGVRRGEKLFEELYFDDEQTLSTCHPKVRAAYHRQYSLSAVRRAISELEKVIHEPEDVIRQKLHEIVPEYASLPVVTGEAEDRSAQEVRSINSIS